MIIIDGTQYSRWRRPIFAEMRAGGVTAVHVTLAYHASARETLSVIGRWQRRLAEHGDLIQPVHTAADIRRAAAAGRTGIMFGLQNPSPIEDELALVDVFYRLGVRLMQLSYNNQSLLATGCYESDDAGITRFGREVIRAMNRVGMAVDMSHSAERSTLEAIEISESPIVISHAHPLFWHDSPRGKSDAVLKALAQSGGLFGFSLYPLHLGAGAATTLADFCAVVARTAELMSVDHIGLGSDLCQDQPPAVLAWMRHGRWDRPRDEATAAEPSAWPAQPAWFQSNADFPNLVGGLRDVGFTAAEVAQIMGDNWLRFCEEVWR